MGDSWIQWYCCPKTGPQNKVMRTKQASQACEREGLLWKGIWMEQVRITGSRLRAQKALGYSRKTIPESGTRDVPLSLVLSDWHLRLIVVRFEVCTSSLSPSTAGSTPWVKGPATCGLFGSTRTSSGACISSSSSPSLSCKWGSSEN